MLSQGNSRNWESRLEEKDCSSLLFLLLHLSQSEQAPNRSFRIDSPSPKTTWLFSKSNIQKANKTPQRTQKPLKNPFPSQTPIPVEVQYWAASARNPSHGQLHAACPGWARASPEFLWVFPAGDPFLPAWTPLTAQSGNQHPTASGNLNRGLHFPRRESRPHWWLASPHTSSWNKTRQDIGQKFQSNRSKQELWVLPITPTWLSPRQHQQRLPAPRCLPLFH